MTERSDDLLLAFLDGSLDEDERRAVESWLAEDSAAGERLAGFAETTALVRAAYDEVLREPLPERLIAAARGNAPAPRAEAKLLTFPSGGRARPALSRRWWVGVSVAASLIGIVVGGGAGYYGSGKARPELASTEVRQPGVETVAATNSWLENAAGYYKLAANSPALDVPPTADPREILQKISQSLSQEVRLPDLKPWGLSFHGARVLVIEGRPAAQLLYVDASNKVGPLSLIIGSSKRGDVSPTVDRRQDLNLMYWRHQGRAYAIVGQVDVGYLWTLANDIAWQLDAI